MHDSLPYGHIGKPRFFRGMPPPAQRQNLEVMSAKVSPATFLYSL